MKRRMLKRLFWITLSSLGLLLSLLVGSLALLLYHPAVPAWALGMIRSHTALSVEVDRLEGRLAGPLAVQGLRLSGQDRRLQVADLNLDWRPSALLGGELHLLSFTLSGASLTLPSPASAEAGSGSDGFAGLSLPLGLRIDHLALEAVTIEGAGDSPVHIDRLSLAARTLDGNLQLERLALAMPRLTLQAAGRVGLATPLPVALDLSWRFTPPERPELQGSGKIAGDLRQLRVTQMLSGLLAGRLEAAIDDPLGEISWDASAHLGETELSDWATGFPLRAGGELRSRGTPERIGLEADLALSQPELGAAQVTLRGDYAQGRLNVEQLLLTTPAGSRLLASGHYQPDKELGRFDGELTWQALRWPLQGASTLVASTSGSLKLHGRPQAYDYDLSAGLQLPGKPMAEIAAQGAGDLQGLRLAQLLASFKPGEIRGQGEVAWRPSANWRLQLQGKGIDPARWVDGFPGGIEFAAESEGRFADTGLRAEVQLKHLQGSLRGYPLEAEGRARLEGEALDLQALRFDSGANRIEVAGRVGQSLALDWQIDAPELQGLWPGLTGRLKGSGRLEGDRQLPRLRAELSGEGVSYGQNRIGKLQLTSDLSLSGGQALSLDLRAAELHTEGGSWQAAELQLAGSLPAHRLTLALRGKASPSLQTRIEAGWREEGRWQGRLQALTLDLPRLPSWRLAKPAGFVLGAETQRIESLCLVAGDGSLCGDFEHAEQSGWQAGLAARAFPLATLEPWLPGGLQMDGSAALQARLAADAAGQTRGDLQLQLPAGRLGLSLESAAEHIDFSGGALTGKIDGEAATLKLHLPMAGLGEAQGEVSLPGVNPLALEPSTQALRGHLRLKLADLSRLSLIWPRLQNPRGGINGEFALAGTLGQPQLSGGAELQGGALDIPELGLELREIALQLKAPSRERLSLQGGVRSGKGHLALQGEMELDAEAGFPARLHLSGKKFRVANIPEAEVLVSPDVRLERDPQGSRIKGRIEIPYARLRPRKLPSTAVTVTPDLVVVGADEPERQNFDPRLSAELRLVMGDRVSFDGFGLRGRLSGSLLVIDEPKRPVIGRGRIGIVDGTYRAYGQDLSIERGFANFVDSPVDNPGLDVRAVREIEEVTAGVRVGGTLKKPKIDLFSTPSMGESDILSYLLTGRPAGEGGGESIGIAAALKASGAGTVAEELGRQFGLEELRFDAGNGMEEASVVAGTYLSPRLYVQYVNELTSRETKLRLRYDINKRLQLEAETGKTQAGDLYYTFDR